MRVGLFQLESGLSGDMFLGALVGAGASLPRMEEAVRAVGGEALALREEAVLRAGLAGTRIHVLYEGRPIEESGGPDAQGSGLIPAPARPSGTGHHPHPPPGGHHHPHQEGLPAPAVSYGEILRRLSHSTLVEEIRSPALAVFRLLAETEARLHGTEPTAVHFHELGSWDALADVVAAVAGLAELRLEGLYHGPVALGGGTVDAAHGVLPVPAPVTLELLAGRPCRFGAGGERTTPTGAALLAVLAEPAPAELLLVPDRVGYGAGRADPPDRPNLARLVLGRRRTPAALARVAVVEAALDDFTPEEGGHLLEALLGAGALDASLTPLVMKKSRPGFLVRVLTEAGRGPEFADLLLRRSSTLGARWREETRFELVRRVDRVRLPEGEVRIKIARLPDGGERMHPEHDDVARIADLRGVPLADIRREVDQIWRATA